MSLNPAEVPDVVDTERTDGSIDASAMSLETSPPQSDKRVPIPVFTVETDKESAAFTPHPEAAQCLTLVQKQSGWSNVWTYFHIIQDFHNYKVNSKYFNHFQPENKAVSPFWAACNLCGGIILAKPFQKPWTGGGMVNIWSSSMVLLTLTRARKNLHFQVLLQGKSKRSFLRFGELKVFKVYQVLHQWPTKETFNLRRFASGLLKIIFH